jgi:DNA-binding beta-propeller fold protein YncE
MLAASAHRVGGLAVRARGRAVGVLATIGLLVCAPSALASPPAAFRQIAGSPFGPTGTQPASVAFSPSGRLLATGNAQDNTVSVFSVGSSGALTQVSGSPFATGSFPSSVAFSPSGGLLATANENDSTVSVFSVGSGGALTPVAGSPFATGGAPDAVAFSPSGGLLATANAFDQTVSVFAPRRASPVLPITSLAGYSDGTSGGGCAFHVTVTYSGKAKRGDVAAVNLTNVGVTSSGLNPSPLTVPVAFGTTPPQGTDYAFNVKLETSDGTVLSQETTGPFSLPGGSCPAPGELASWPAS